METRQCRGCGTPIVPGSRERNVKVWCSESCRVKSWQQRNPQAKARYAENRQAVMHAASSRGYSLTCTECGEEFHSSRNGKLYCSKACSYRVYRRTRRARANAVSHERYTRSQIVDRDGSSCALCLDPIDLSIAYPHRASASVDHRTPLSRGGTDTLTNVQLAHLSCNWAKGNAVQQ
jgi:hypothetical protein